MPLIDMSVRHRNGHWAPADLVLEVNAYTIGQLLFFFEMTTA